MPWARSVLFLLTISAITSTLACGDVDSNAPDSMTGELATVGQASSTNYAHSFSVAPQAEPHWTILSVATDSQNNVYAAGSFYGGELDFGGGTQMYNEPGSGTDTFVIKLDEGGAVEWQVSFGSDDIWDTTQWAPVDLEVTPNDKVVLAQSWVFCPDAPTGLPCTRAGSLKELDEDGNAVWGDTVGSPNEGDSTWLEAIAVDENDRLTVTGAYEVSFDHGSHQLSPPNGTDVFVLAFDEFVPDSTAGGSGGDDGEDEESIVHGSRDQDWAVDFGGTVIDEPTDIAAGPEGVLAVVGDYTDTHQPFGPSSAPQAANSTTSLFVQTIYPDGTPGAAVGADTSTTADDVAYATGVAFSPRGELYVTGHFEGRLGSAIAANAPNMSPFGVSAFDRDFFVVKYEAAEAVESGNAEWFETSGAPMWEVSNAIAATNEHVAITGYTCDPLTDCSRDGFALVMDPISPSFNGYTVAFGDPGVPDDYGVDVALDGAERVVFGGRVGTSPIDFGGGPLHGGDGFVASFKHQ